MNSNRILGCLVGGAIGDALGGPYEGQTGPVEIDPSLPAWLSDDTQLTLATCEAIVAASGVDPESIAARMLALFRARRIIGIGGSTYQALSALEAGGHWALVGAKGDAAAGNGAAMRVAPLAFCLSWQTDEGRRAIRDVCRITHHNDEAYVGALAVVVAVGMAATGEWQGDRDLLARVAAALPDSRVRDRLREVAEASQAQSLAVIAARFGCSGYVVETVPLALLGAEQFGSIGFQAVLEGLVKAGGDADTTASIAGQIMGACCGYDGLPEDLIHSLPERAAVEASARDFAQFAGG